MRIYLDHNATTPPLPEVIDAVAEAQRDLFGNASSVHHHGQLAKAALDQARDAVANLIGANANEVLLTSGGTESDNLAIRGIAEATKPSGKCHLVTSTIEHEAVLTTFSALEKRGWLTTFVPVDASGVVSPQALDDILSSRNGDTALVSIMHANNEIGTVQPVTALADIAHEHGALFHTDAVQSAGKLPVDVSDLGVDLLSLSGHKFYGPKGTGALWVRRGIRLVKQTTGGKQERNRRAGTENVPAIVGLGVAAMYAAQAIEQESPRLSELRDHLEAGILSGVKGTQVNGKATNRVSNTTNISFNHVEAESLLIALDLEGISVSTGSACSSGTLEPSHVLKAIGLSPHRTQNSIRFSVGLSNNTEQIERVVKLMPRTVAKLRSLNRKPVHA